MPCNICGHDTFEDHRDKPNERCTNCGAKARHRIAMVVYENHLRPLVTDGARVLHLAPEKALHDGLAKMCGDGYITADASPERYPHAKCIKLFFPNDFERFEDGHFTAVLHNHVLEHIPGHYGDHLLEFARLLAPGGKMIFSVPGPYMDRQSEEGGEHLATDAERLEKFLQEDHFKVLGADFVDFIDAMPGGKRIPDGVTDEIRAELSVRPKKAPFFIWQKDS